jgi:predicted alpha/beta superfamily hydrolase
MLESAQRSERGEEITIKEGRPKETNTLIADTEVRYLESSFVDQEFRLCIGPGWLSFSPAQPTGKVPVIYVLDGAIDAIAAVRGLHGGGELPPALVVAIGYPLEAITTSIRPMPRLSAVRLAACSRPMC